MQRDKLIENWFNGSQALQRLWRSQYYAELGEEGVSLAQVSILTYLQENQPVSSKQIAAEMHIGKSAVAQQLDSLDKLRYIVRHEDPTDRRITYIGLSKAGSVKVRSLQSKLKAHFERFAEVLSDGELIAMADIQDKMMARLKQG